MADYCDDVDKQWAKKYILDPLHGPEPSQECGPGSSFRNPNGLQRSFSAQTRPSKAEQSPNRYKPLPAPPVSSPARPRSRPGLPPSHPSSPAVFDSSRPTSRHRNLPDEDTEEDVELLHNFLVRSQSVTEGRTHSTHRSRRAFPPSASLNRSKTVHTAQPRETRWNQGTILTRKSSLASTRNRPDTPSSQNGRRSSGASPMASPSPMTSPVARQADPDKGKGVRRSGSLTARYPGDMSHRPLDTIKQEQRAAMKVPYLHNPRHRQPADTIDTLDQSGIADVPYHHEGPYDATMASRNRKKRYSPLDAVKDSNEEAIKATPREYVQDSLTKHVPLQGTAIIPPGMRDMSGRVMEYEDGADLMRERDAPGGAYKRYEGIVSAAPTAAATTHTYPNWQKLYPPEVADKKLDNQRYRDGDLKGKGEPSYTIERDRKEHEAKIRRHAGSGMGEGDGTQVYEMQPHARSPTALKDHGGRVVRQRSISNADETAGATSPLMRRGSREGYATNNDLRRRNTTGNKLAEGLKRRFGSLRRKKGSEEAY